MWSINKIKLSLSRPHQSDDVTSNVYEDFH